MLEHVLLEIRSDMGRQLQSVLLETEMGLSRLSSPVDDPKVEGVSCFVSRARTGGISGSLGLAEDTSDASINCQQTGPIRISRPLPTLARVVATGEEWDCWQWLHYATTRHDESGLVWHVLTRTDDNLGFGRATKRAEARA